MKFLWIVTCSLLISRVVVGQNEVSDSYLEGYCWRDFTGYIPSDALPGGIDKQGETTYIGQALHPGGFITPGWIRRSSDKVSYESGNQEHLQSLSAKILCSQRPEQFIWFSITNKHPVNDLNGNRLIIGGQESSGVTPIGRISKGTEIIVGKVIIANDKLDTLYYTSEGRGFSSSSFEVLLYNITAGKSNHLACSNKKQPVTINFFSHETCSSKGNN